MRRLIARKGISIETDWGEREREQPSGRNGVAQRSQSTTRISSSTPILTPQPRDRILSSSSKSVNFQDTTQKGKQQDPLLRVSDGDRSFSFSPTKPLDWGSVRKSIKMQVDTTLLFSQFW
jgi:hypothetical protein